MAPSPDVSNAPSVATWGGIADGFYIVRGHKKQGGSVWEHYDNPIYFYAISGSKFSNMSLMNSGVSGREREDEECRKSVSPECLL